MPATLLTAYPIFKRDFAFVLSGFDEAIEGVIFMDPFIGFDEPVVFQYFATSSNGRWVSALNTVTYQPERIKKDKQVLCQSKIEVPPLALQRR
jgi:hypothetical protein